MSGGEAAFALWLLLLGAAGASFVGVVAERSCAGRDWIGRRSSCDACGRQIAARDLVPVVSFARLRGRCRSCGKPIPPALLWAEVAGLAAAAAALALGGPAAERIGATMFLVLLIGLHRGDRLCRRLPDALTAPLAGAGLWIGAQEHGAGSAALGALIGAGALWLLADVYRRARGREGLGMGDVKMMAGLGAMAGPLALPWITLIAAASGLGAAVMCGALRGAPPRGADELPFGCHLAVAGALVWAGTRAGV